MHRLVAAASSCWSGDRADKRPDNEEHSAERREAGALEPHLRARCLSARAPKPLEDRIELEVLYNFFLRYELLSQG